MTRLLVVDEEASEEAEAQVRYYAERAGTHIALRFAAEIEAVYRGLAEERLVGVSYPRARHRSGRHRSGGTDPTRHRSGVDSGANNRAAPIRAAPIRGRHRSGVDSGGTDPGLIRVGGTDPGRHRSGVDSGANNRAAPIRG